MEYLKTFVIAMIGMGLLPAFSIATDRSDFFNIIASNGADPWMIKHEGMYYLAVTTTTDVTIYRSKSISAVAGGEKKVIWKPPAKGPFSKNIWAPELHYLDGKWYVYVACDDGDNANHRMYVLENPSADPFQGEFKLKGKIFDPQNDRWAIDGTVLTVKNQRYFIWSGWEGTDNIRQNLYIAPMSNSWTISGQRVEISRPTLKWELNGTPNINEGPQVLIKGNAIHIVYSASGSWTDHYCLGMLTAKTGDDLLKPSSWKKHAEPVLQTGNGVIAPGHCSFVTSPDGKDDWIVYHAARHTKSAWARNVRIQKFDWHADDTPNFGSPTSCHHLIPLPTGDANHIRLEAEDALLTGRAKAIRNPQASNKAEVGSIEDAESGVEFKVKVKEAGNYALIVRGRSDTVDVKKRASHLLAVNRVPLKPIQYEYTAGDLSIGEVSHIKLNAGDNSIWFAKGNQTAAIDCIDLVPAGK